MPEEEPVEPVEPLHEFCEEQGFPDFSRYCKEAKVHECLEGVVCSLLTEKPPNPRQYLLEKFREEYPLERYTKNVFHSEIL